MGYFSFPSLLKGLTGIFMWPLPRRRHCPNLRLFVYIGGSQQGTFCPQGTLRQCLEAFGVVTAVGAEVLRASGGQRPDMLPNILQRSGQGRPLTKS